MKNKSIVLLVFIFLFSLLCAVEGATTKPKALAKKTVKKEQATKTSQKSKLTGKNLDGKIFKDIYSTFWGREEIETLANAKILSGQNGMFYPEKKVTRADFCLMVAKANGQNVDFSGVSKKEKKAKIISIVKEISTSGGYYSWYKNINKPVKRGEATKVLVIFDEVSVPFRVTYTPFVDISTKNPIAPYVVAAYEANNKGFTGSGAKFKPERDATKAEAAVMLYRTSFWKTKQAGLDQN